MSKGFELIVQPSDRFIKDYLLSNISVKGKVEALDFFWEKKGKKKAWITFSIDANLVASSLPLTPFGGIFILEKLHSESLLCFIQKVLDTLKNKGVTQIEITGAPKPYEENHDLIGYLLQKQGFELKNMLSHQFFLGRKKIKKWVQQEYSRYQKKMNQHHAFSASINSITNFNFLKEIRLWNVERGYEFQLDDNRIIMQVSEYPERYFLISILESETPVAHCLAVKLFSDSIYYFLSAINPNSSLKNGGELLLANLFKLANDEKVKFIDLGSSDLGDEINHPLMFFKSKFANDISNKETWVKSYKYEKR
ncbi:hypothetical protein JYB62_09050 [Algoriphagus lutimaris]|uniref:hypothetical protein n=1 Tax=Algoriphagus lutimaris TaxID=613197 RepID=UPI00196B569E|nr:hypothetical protein [Algoriphagus lutimaris]MBN3520149.1 hypothetical protein [Algoriphagus lutimaris]